jgi:hypothetical protein
MFNTETNFKVRENRLRRTAVRYGMNLQKSRRRDPQARDYGTYRLVDVRTNVAIPSVSRDGYDLTIDEVGRWLGI